MRVLNGMLSAVLCITLLAPGAALARQGQHVAGPEALDRLIAEQVQQEEADREVIRDVLRRDDVRRIAQQAGVDLARAEAAVATLSGAELQQAAAQARQVEQGLSGGASAIVISTTALVLVLLVVLLIVIID